VASGILVIVDDYSWYSWVFFLESKERAIRGDNGTEFRNASFDQFFLEHGVD
jgi:hypothetical protein